MTKDLYPAPPLYPTAALFVGDFVEERVVLLAGIPEDSLTGAQLRVLHVLMSRDIVADPNNYWTMEVGKIATGSFTVLVPTVSFSSGVQANVLVSYPNLVLYSRGDKPAVRFTPVGFPVPITGVCLLPEWGILSSQKAQR